LLFTAVMGVRTLLGNASTRNLGRVVLCAAVAFGIWVFQWPNAFGTPNDPRILAWNGAAHGIDELVRRNSGPAKAHVFVGGVSAVSSDALRFLALQHGAEAPDCVMPVIDDPEAVARELDIADFAVATDDGVCETAQYVYPSNLAQGRTLASVRARKDYTEIGFFPMYPKRGYHLFQRITAGDPFAGLEEVQGLTGVEGPYPQWHLPIVRWGSMPETRIALPSSGHVLIQAASQAQFPDQVATFIVDEKQVAQRDYPRLYTFYVTSLELELAPGSLHTLVIRYKKSGGGSSGRAVLFRQLSVHPLPATRSSN